jgi:hypothetical protein
MPPKSRFTPRKGPIVPIPIVPKDGLFLWDWGMRIPDQPGRFCTPKSITQKFVTCFDKAWEQIPESDRKTLTDHWKKIGGSDGGRPIPFIDFNNPRLPISLAAACGSLGAELFFSAVDTAARKPKSCVQVIAHELGHAISYAHGWDSQHQCKAFLGECVACECRAYSYMAAWGFDPFVETLPKAKKGQSLRARLARE